MIVDKYRKEKGVFGNKKEVLELGYGREKQYLRLSFQNYNDVNLNDFDSCLESVCMQEKMPVAEIDIKWAHIISSNLENAIQKLFSLDLDMKMLRNDLHYYRTNLSAEGHYSFTTSLVTYARIIYRAAVFDLDERTQTARKSLSNFYVCKRTTGNAISQGLEKGVKRPIKSFVYKTGESIYKLGYGLKHNAWGSMSMRHAAHCYWRVVHNVPW